jgi:transposase
MKRFSTESGEVERKMPRMKPTVAPEAAPTAAPRPAWPRTAPPAPPAAAPPPPPPRRRFTAEYKLRILQEADELAKVGGVGELLRREGLYSSHLAAWRRERDQGGRAALSRKRGRKVSPDAAVSREVRKLSSEVDRLRRRLAQAEAIIEVQKKIAGLLGIPLKADGSDGSDS